MNPLQNIPARVRGVLYTVYGLLVVASGGLAAYFGAVDQPLPKWAVGAGAVLLYVGGAVGFTAAANVKRPVAGRR